MKLKPFITAVDDCHDFRQVVSHLYNAGFENVKFIEKGWFFPSDYVDGNHEAYHAVFYQQKQTKEVKNLVRFLDEAEQKYSEEWNN